MKRTTLYLIIIGILLALNVLQLGFGFAKHKKHREAHKKGFRHDIEQTLQLNDTQKEQFWNFAKVHKQKMRALGRQHRNLTKAYFENPSEALMDSIKTLEGQKLELTRQHFIEVQTLLDDKQKERFKEFKHKAMRKMVR